MSAEGKLSLDDVRSWAGHRLDEIGGGSVGKVEGALVDSETRVPAWLLARMGRFGHYTVIPVRDAVEGARRVWVPYTRDLIRRAPKVEPGSSLSAKLERELLDHYGIAAGGRLTELAGREPDAITAQPPE
ncbi:MAG TPA: hypothetical protein VK919_02655 [Solirubrobacterales bacterium]|nr:hypothetical protein [Solirubrobacterales bacterium]